MRLENSFLPVRGVGVKTERRLWEAGITHWDEFDGSVVGPTIADRIEDYIETARPAIERGDLGFVAGDLPGRSRWRLLENAGRATCYLDIETTGLDHRRHQVTTVTTHMDGHTETVVAGRDDVPGALEATLSEASLLVTYNGASFDVPFLEAAYDLKIDPPHLDLRYPCRRCGLEGGLSTIESAVGFDRSVPDVDGLEAIRLWRRYERGDEAALERLVTYNQEDTVVLESLAAAVADRLHKEVFEAVVGAVSPRS